MLKKSHITNIEIYSEAWHKHRLTKFTSSKAVKLISSGDGFYTYIYQKVGEALTGVSNDKEFVDFDEDLEWGLKYEADAIRAFGKKMGIDFMVTQKLISDPEGQFASTPDAIWVHGECKIDTSEYNVSTAEGKCPRTFHWFIKFCMCDTPADVKKVKSDYYWQTIDQMHQCGAAVGYFFVYHPFFPEGSNLKIVKFTKMELWDDFKILAAQKKLAVQKFAEIKSKMQALSV
jgi:hypothetical protein